MDERGHSLDDARHQLEIDAEGDFVIVIEAVELKVNSRFIFLASNILKSMMESAVRDGDTVEFGGELFPSINLQQDNPDAITILCSIFHHQDCPQSNDIIGIMRDVAYAADKYNCTEIVLPWFEVRMDEFRQMCVQHLAKHLLLPAILINDAEGFQHITKCMVYFQKGFRNPQRVLSRVAAYEIDSNISNHLPQYLLETMVCREWETKKKIAFQLEQLLQPLLIQDFNNVEPMQGDSRGRSDVPHHDDGRSTSECDARHIGQYIQALHAQGLWPISSVLDNFTIDEILSRIKSVRIGFSPCSENSQSCTPYLEKQLKELAERAESYFPGLYLDCVKDESNHRDKNERNCRIAHEGDLGLMDEDEEFGGLD